MHPIKSSWRRLTHFPVSSETGVWRPGGDTGSVKGITLISASFSISKRDSDFMYFSGLPFLFKNVRLPSKRIQGLFCSLSPLTALSLMPPEISHVEVNTAFDLSPPWNLEDRFPGLIRIQIKIYLYLHERSVCACMYGRGRWDPSTMSAFGHPKATKGSIWRNASRVVLPFAAWAALSRHSPLLFQ